MIEISSNELIAGHIEDVKKRIGDDNSLNVYIYPSELEYILSYHGGSSELTRSSVTSVDPYDWQLSLVKAKLAKISNLVVGLGVSSVAAESSFFGTNSFHFDNLNLQNENDFCKNNLNKIVFNEVQNLENAINDQILNGKMSVKENKLLHGQLDPFQDGKASHRTALIIDLIFKKHDKLKNLDSLFKEVDNLIKNNEVLFKESYY